MIMLAYGLITGIAFGFLLQKGRVLRYDKQLGALLLKDMTIIKFMLSSVMVGMIGVYLLVDLGFAELNIKATVLGGILSVAWSLVSAGGCLATARVRQQALLRRADGMRSGVFSAC